MRDEGLVTRLSRDLESLLPFLRSHAVEADRRFALTDEVVKSLHRLGLFRLWIPKRYGGFELPLAATLEIYEAVARIDGSVGWTVMIGAGGGLFGAYLQEEVAGDGLCAGRCQDPRYVACHRHAGHGKSRFRG